MSYVKVNGAGQTPVTSAEYIIESSLDLEGLIDCPVGSIAYTAGFAEVYHKGLDGQWVKV